MATDVRVIRGRLEALIQSVYLEERYWGRIPAANMPILNGPRRPALILTVWEASSLARSPCPMNAQHSKPIYALA